MKSSTPEYYWNAASGHSVGLPIKSTKKKKKKKSGIRGFDMRRIPSKRQCFISCALYFCILLRIRSKTEQNQSIAHNIQFIIATKTARTKNLSYSS